MNADVRPADHERIMTGRADHVELPAIEHAYRVLGVSRDSSALRIKREYRRLARMWHPDKFVHNTPDQRRAAERMREINAAFQLLKHAPLRYRPDDVSQPAERRSGSGPVATMVVTDRTEYIVRLVCGVVFGLAVSLLLLLADAPVAVVAVLPLFTGAASAVFGDRFWYWVLRSWWLWA